MVVIRFLKVGANLQSQDIGNIFKRLRLFFMVVVTIFKITSLKSTLTFLDLGESFSLSTFEVRPHPLNFHTRTSKVRCKYFKKSR